MASNSILISYERRFIYKIKKKKILFPRTIEQFDRCTFNFNYSIKCPQTLRLLINTYY